MRACTASLFSSCEVEEETQIRDELTSPPLPDSGTGDDPNFEVRADYMKIRTLQPLPSYPQPRTRPRPTCPPEVRGYGWVQVWYRSNPTPTPRHQNFRLSTITAAAIILERPPQPPPFLHRLLRPTPRCLGFDSREMEVTAEDEAPKKSTTREGVEVEALWQRPRWWRQGGTVSAFCSWPLLNHTLSKAPWWWRTCRRRSRIWWRWW